jgi:hypothetical protein
MSLSLSIVEQPNVIDDHLLDIIGNEFKFSHEKGLPEWLKNSADAYIRQSPAVPDEQQHILLNFVDGRSHQPPTFECIDFCGLTSTDINKALKRWGDPKASSRNTGRRTYGGHGNGGKFYMRQMFERSHFITFRDGKLNIFGFNEKKKYGFARDFKDKDLSPKQAYELAGLNTIDVPSDAKNKILAGGGFTMVRGIRPDRIRGVIPISRLVDKLRLHPQARKLIQRKPIKILHNGKVIVERLNPEQVPLRAGYETIPQIPIPVTLQYDEDGQSKNIAFSNARYKQGYLKLFVAQEPFGINGRLSELNSIDILGEIGVIASYRVQKLLHIKQYAQAEFMFGECYCPILEDPEDDCVSNDREDLISSNPKSQALLKWIALQVDELGKRLEQEEARERKLENLRLSDEFNKILNTWKNQFMDKILTEVLGGLQPGNSSGGRGEEGSGGPQGRHSDQNGGNHGEGSAKGGGGGSEPKQGPRHPIVLLSSYNPDPFGSGETLHLSPRHNPMYQRPVDVESGVYWINTSRPLATEILKRYGAESPRWREYHFQRFIDIIVMESLHRMEKRGLELTFDLVENKINDVIKMVHDNALEKIGHFLL